MESQVNVSSHDRPGARLVNLMRGAQLAVLVDAVRSGNPLGILHRLEGEEIHPAVSRYTSTHGFGLAEALILARRLDTAPQRIVLLGMEGSNVGMGEMSVAMRDGIPKLVNAVMEEVGQALAGFGYEK